MPPVVIPGVIELAEPEVWSMGAALVMMILDVMSGFGAALIRGEVSSTKMREGLGHKAMLVLMVAVAIVLQAATLHIGDMGWSFPLIVPCCVYIIVMELSSIMENASGAYPALAGTPLMRLFERVGDAASGDGGEGGGAE